MIDTKIIFLAQLQAKLWPFKDLAVPPGGQISNPRKIQNTRCRAKKFGIFAYLLLGYLYTKNEKNLFFWGFIVCTICAEITCMSIVISQPSLVNRRYSFVNSQSPIVNRWVNCR